MKKLLLAIIFLTGPVFADTIYIITPEGIVRVCMNLGDGMIKCF